MTSPPTQPLKVALIVPAKKLFCLGSFLWMQRYGPLQVASIVQEAGYSVKLFNEEFGNHVSPLAIALNYDVAGISSKTSAITRAEEIAQQIKLEAKKIGRNVVTVLGGEHASTSGGNRISSHFDHVLLGESEYAFVEILKSIELERHGAKKSLRVLPSKGFYRCKSFNNVPDFSVVEGYEAIFRGLLLKYFPLIWFIRNKSVPTLSFQGSRGCPYDCSFCPTPKYLQGRAYRRRDVESAIVYLKEHIAKSGIKKVFFEDPTAAIPFDKESYKFFQSLAENSVDMNASVLVRVDLCKDENLLEVMRAAGVSSVGIGIESLSDKTRNDFKKKISSDMIARSIEIFHRHGFMVSGLFIVGSDTEDLDSFTKIEKFINDTGMEQWRVSPLGQMSEVPNQFLATHRAFLWTELDRFGHDLADYMNGHFVIFFPKNMRPSILQEKIEKFNYSCASWAGTVKLLLKQKRFVSVLNRMGNNLAQKMLQKEIAKSNYIEMLKELEQPFYIKHFGNDILQEELLIKRYREKRSVPA